MAQTTQKVFSPFKEGLIDTVKEAEQGTAFADDDQRTALVPQKLAYIETYGCQMNFSDTEIIASVLTETGYGFTNTPEDANLILINTCSIRDNAEPKSGTAWPTGSTSKSAAPILLVGVMGCMAERLKTKLMEEKQVCGSGGGPRCVPRACPNLIAEVEGGQKAVNVLLSREETYADMAPIRLNTNGVSAFISIMRGCDNMCAFCVVPFTRGPRALARPQEHCLRSRDLVREGYREVTLLGQNVDSYKHDGVNFARLLEMVASSRPASADSLQHQPPQGHDRRGAGGHGHLRQHLQLHSPARAERQQRVLDLMRRGHTREWYLDKIAAIRRNTCPIARSARTSSPVSARDRSPSTRTRSR